MSECQGLIDQIQYDTIIRDAVNIFLFHVIEKKPSLFYSLIFIVYLCCNHKEMRLRSGYQKNLVFGIISSEKKRSWSRAQTFRIRSFFSWSPTRTQLKNSNCPVSLELFEWIFLFFNIFFFCIFIRGGYIGD